jgi:hypothetical protein
LVSGRPAHLGAIYGERGNSRPLAETSRLRLLDARRKILPVTSVWNLPRRALTAPLPTLASLEDFQEKQATVARKLPTAAMRIQRSRLALALASSLVSSSKESIASRMMRGAAFRSACAAMRRAVCSGSIKGARGRILLTLRAGSVLAAKSFCNSRTSIVESVFALPDSSRARQ